MRLIITLFSDAVIAYNEEIISPIIEVMDIAAYQNTLSYTPKARYRCTQHNVTKVLDKITLDSEVKMAYIVKSS